MKFGQFDFSIAGTIATATNYVTSAGTTILGKAPSASLGGGLTIIGCFAEFRGGTAPFTIVDFGSTGTTPTGTIASISGAYTAAAPVQSADPAGYFLAAGNYVGVVMAAGTVQYPGGVHVQFAVGRGGA